MKTQKLLLIFVLYLFATHVQAQKYTINFTPAIITVNEDTGTIQITATISPAPTSPVGIDVILDKANGDFSPKVITTLGYQAGETVASISLNILDHKGMPYKRIHHFGLEDFMHAFTKGHDSILTLTVVDNDSTQDAGIQIPAINPLSVNIYPNPAHGTITISAPMQLSGKMNISLIDITGQVLKTYEPYTMPTQPITLSLPENAKGILLLKIASDNGMVYKQVLVE